MGMKPRCPRPLLKRAIQLGIVSGVVASLLLWGVSILPGLLSGKGLSSSSHVDPYAVLIIAVIGTIVVSLVPGTIGGAANAWVLHWLSSEGRLTRVTSIVPGLLMGFLLGFATIPGIDLISGDIAFVIRYRLAETVELALIVGCVAAPVGGWHGWRLGKWLLEAQ